MRILAIETSCDETGVCIIEADGDFGAQFSYTVLGNALISQTEIHAPYGGVFPNLARREHERNLVPQMTAALHEAGLLKEGAADFAAGEQILSREAELRVQLGSFLAAYAKPDIEAIAVTHGPGLEPALWVGVNFARALAAAWQVPIVPVNHMEGHIVLSMMEGSNLAPFKFPLLSLLISGGHTELVLSKEWGEYELLGQTRDDAVGEAFDKVARLLDLPYPGGPEISMLATKARETNLPRTIQLPRPMIDTDDYDFSFSGLKTAVRRLVETHQPLTEAMKMEIAREFEDTTADVLVAKTMRAIEEYGAEAILVGGGVSANEHIRSRLASSIKDYGYGTKLLIPPPQLATDNALMIALAGYFRAQKKEFADPNTLRANGNTKLT
jgi:N6-L-threonylcarbamoyladenine synthase